MHKYKRRALGICSCSYFFIYIIPFIPDNNFFRCVEMVLLFNFFLKKERMLSSINMNQNENSNPQSCVLSFTS